MAWIFFYQNQPHRNNIDQTAKRLIEIDSFKKHPWLSRLTDSREPSEDILKYTLAHPEWVYGILAKSVNFQNVKNEKFLTSMGHIQIDQHYNKY